MNVGKVFNQSGNLYTSINLVNKDQSINVDEDAALEVLAKFQEFANKGLDLKDAFEFISNLTPDQLKAVLSDLTPDQLKNVLANLSPDQLKLLLSDLSPEQLKNILANLSPDQLNAVLSDLPLDQLNKVLSDLSPEQLNKVWDSLNPEEMKLIIRNLDSAQVLSALGQINHEKKQAILGYLTPDMLHDAFGKLNKEQLFQVIADSPAALVEFLNTKNANLEDLQALKEWLIDSLGNPELQLTAREMGEGNLKENISKFIETCIEQQLPEVNELFDHLMSNNLLGANGSGGEDHAGDEIINNLVRNLYNPLTSNSNSRNYENIDVMKMIFLIMMDVSNTNRDSLARLAKSLNDVKEDTKELNRWWDMIGEMSKGSSSMTYKKGDTTTTIPNPGPNDILVHYDELTAEDKKKFAPFVNLVKENFKQYLKADGSFDFPTGKDADHQLCKDIQNYMNNLTKRLDCNDIKFPGVGDAIDWASLRSTFEKRNSEANGINQEKSSLISAASTQLQTAVNLLTKFLETNAAIMQKSSS
ncbi:MAG: hypothetical protein PHC75_06140 [Burkholderiales bacterium]|nr:hypothetical protein [Burkholderiales bacterium]